MAEETNKGILFSTHEIDSAIQLSDKILVMSPEGNYFEHYIRDIERFKTDSEYKAGWLAGEAEGKRLQQQANEMGAAASEYRINEEVKKTQDFDQIGKDAVKDVDTTELKSLEK